VADRRGCRAPVPLFFWLAIGQQVKAVRALPALKLIFNCFSPTLANPYVRLFVSVGLEPVG